jgi:hypothetical protein
VVVSAPTRAAVEIELEVRVALRRGRDRVTGGSRERRPAEIRVDDHAGCVEDPSQRRQLELSEQLARSRRQVVIVLVAGSGMRAAGKDLAPPFVDCAPSGRDGEPVGRIEGRGELVDRRERPQLSGARGAVGAGASGIGVGRRGSARGGWWWWRGLGVDRLGVGGVGGVPFTQEPSSFFQMGA